VGPTRQSGWVCVSQSSKRRGCSNHGKQTNSPVIETPQHMQNSLWLTLPAREPIITHPHSLFISFDPPPNHTMWGPTCSHVRQINNNPHHVFRLPAQLSSSSSSSLPFVFGFPSQDYLTFCVLTNNDTNNFCFTIPMTD
jgi:hypothetical protein